MEVSVTQVVVISDEYVIRNIDGLLFEKGYNSTGVTFGYGETKSDKHYKFNFSFPNFSKEYFEINQKLYIQTLRSPNTIFLIIYDVEKIHDISIMDDLENIMKGYDKSKEVRILRINHKKENAKINRRLQNIERIYKVKESTKRDSGIPNMRILALIIYTAQFRLEQR